jgi:hypothetical protein
MATHTDTPRKNKRRSHQNQNHNHNPHHQNHQHHTNNLAYAQQQQAYAQQPQPVTDYETDAYIDIQPPPMTRTNEELNHAVLRRYYPHITHILSIASYAVLYQFSPDSSSWVKLEIEGTLFICQLTPSELGAKRFDVIILNRRGFDNFEHELKSSEDVEVTSEYVILKGESNQGEEVIYGLWIFAEQGASTEAAREENAEEIARCAREAEESGKAALQRFAHSQEHAHAGEGNGYAAEVEESGVEEDDLPGSVAMGRQLSLRELFGKQRELDAGFSVKHHESPKFANAQPVLPSIQQRVEEEPTPPLRQSTPQPVAQEKATTPMFFNNPDTDFFRSGPRFTPQQSEEPVAAPAPVVSDSGAAQPPPTAANNPLLALLLGKS